MAQKAQVIDVTKSYIPGDPNAFPENLVNTSQEDGEEKTPAVMPFEGYNFLPTPHGYRSYFGTTSRLDIPQVPARVQFILSYQSDTFINNLIALCEDGIWVIDPTANTNTWKHVVTHTFSAEVFEEWTYCVIENTVYMYKQGKDFVYYTSNTDDVPNGLSISIQSFTPSFLNMSGQLGIFRAGTRLGFWDSANSIAWSSNLDLTDFTPSLENLAGNTIFGLVTGRVVHVREQGEGFVIYATKSIVGVSFSAEGNMLWDSHLISDVCGIAYGREVCFGVSNNEHYVHTSIGLHRVGSYNGLTKVHEFTPIATELSDVLAEERDPVYLDCIGGRYIYIHAISDTYINGKVSFTSVTVDSLDIEAVFNLDPSLVSRELFVKMIQNFEKNSADSTYGDTLVKYTADGIPFDILEWEASYRAISPLGMYEKLVNPSLGASFAYQNASSLDRSSIGWSNRTPSSGTFVPPNGDYNSLDSGVPLVSYSDFTIRETKEDDFSKPIAKTLRFQTDAFTHEDNLGTYDLSYQLRKSCGTEPSFLEINGRTSYGLLEGMYNVASHWKDYEKRQKLVIDNFTGIVENLKPFNWNAYSVDGTLEAAIEAPIYEIFDLFKPYGCVGIAPVGKGFSFFKNYREYYDCVIGSFRDVTEINTYKEVENCEFNSPVSYSLEDKMDIVLSMPGGGVSVFPNPRSYPLICTTLYTPGTDFDPGPVGYEYSNNVVYAIIDEHGNESDITTLASLVSDESYTIRTVNPPPLGYSYRLYLSSTYGNYIDIGGGAHLDTTQGFLKYQDIVLNATDSVTISSLDFFSNDLASYPVGKVDKVGNTYVDPLPSTAGFDIVIYTPGTVQLEVRVALLKSNRYGPFSYVGSATTDPYEGFDLVTPALPAGYTAVAYEVRINHPNYQHRVVVGTTVGSYRFDLTTYPGTRYPLDPSYAWQSSGPIIWGIDIVGSYIDFYATIPYDKASPTYIQDVITNSQISGIEFEGLETMEFKDLSDQYISSPLSETGSIPLRMQNSDGLGDFQATCTISHRVSLNKDWDLNAGDTTRFEVRTATEEQAAKYPFLVYVKGADALISIYKSYNQVFSQLAGYGRYLRLTVSMITGLNGDQYFLLSPDPTEYYTDWEGDYIRVHGRVWDVRKQQWRYEVVMLMQQTDGFIYEYKVAEEPFGSIVDNKKVDLTGSAISPALDSEGVYNTLGGFFMPKNKISATLNGSSLTLGASTSIGEYEAKEAEILDFLTPANNTFGVPKYLMPPTYDSGEYWFLVKDAEKIYSSGTIFDFKVGEITSFDNIFWNTPLYLDDFIPYDVPDNDSTVIQELLGTLPGSSFILQEGGISGSYPTFVGAHIYDLFLKKWGKMKENYKIIFAYSALNNGDNGFIPYSNFGMDCGVVLEVDNKISLFDKAPVDSWMRIGKIGYSRLGFTRAYEVKAMFRSPSTGKITLDVSLDGRTLETSLQVVTSFNNKVKCDMYPDISGRWHTLKIEGNYDLQYLEFRGTIAGRR